MAKFWADKLKNFKSQKDPSVDKSIDKHSILNDAFFGGILNAAENQSASSSSSSSSSSPASRMKEHRRPMVQTQVYSHNNSDNYSDSLSTNSTSSMTSSMTSSTQSWETLQVHVTYSINSRNQPEEETNGHWDPESPFALYPRLRRPHHSPNSSLHQPARICSVVEDVMQIGYPSFEAIESQCAVCAEDRPRDEYPTAAITSTCTHPTTDVCKQCMRTYIGSELSNRGTAAMSCPVCREPMSYFDVMRNAAPEDFSRYDERMAIESLQNEPGFRWCPQSGCPGGQIQAYGDAEPKVTCNHCRQPFCFTHRVRWHTGLTCSQYDEMPEHARRMREAEEEAERAAAEAARSAASEEAIREQQRAAEERERRRVEEQQGEAYVQSMARRCPNCHSPTERNGGCKHMTCTKCAFEWCWECMTKWVSGHLDRTCRR